MNTSNLKQSSFLILLIFLVIISGCSTKPSDKDGRQVLENLLEEQTKGKVKLVDFKKLNAEEGELMGVKLYGIEFEAEVEFLEECYYRVREEFLDGITPGIVIDKPMRFGWGEVNMFGLKKAHPSMREKLSGKLLFEKTEKGWKGMDGKVY